MILIAIFFVILFALAIAFAWLADNPGTVTVQWPWLDTEVQISLLQAVIGLASIVAVVMAAWWIISGILKSPQTFGRWRKGRRRDKGYAALSKGLVAAGAGNAPLARKLSKESGKLLEYEPLVAMLDAQTALLEGRREDARGQFESMLDNEETKLLGLRGLYVEAEKEKASEAAAHFAKQAIDHAPGTPWAAQAVLKSQSLEGDWEGAIRTLDNNRASGLYERPEYSRKRAVVLTGLAIKEENSDPEMAKTHALAAHKLAPDLVPAAVLAAQICTRMGDTRKAAKVLETTWKRAPHPEIAAAYTHIHAGDAATDRLKRARSLASKNAGSTEGKFAIATAAADAAEWDVARDAMEGVLADNPSERAFLLMADIEEGQHGDRGRVREWLARAVGSPRDAAWTADGVVSKSWAPCSPITGQLDTFEWKNPAEQLGSVEAIDYSKLANQPLPEPEPVLEQDEIINEPSRPSAADAVAAGLATASVASHDRNADEKIATPQSAEDHSEEEDKSSDSVADPVSTVGEGSSTEETADESTEPDLAASNGGKAKSASPFTNTNFDEDSDGVIDHRPDDPGIADDQADKHKATFF